LCASRKLLSIRRRLFLCTDGPRIDLQGFCKRQSDMSGYATYQELSGASYSDQFKILVNADGTSPRIRYSVCVPVRAFKTVRKTVSRGTECPDSAANSSIGVLPKRLDEFRNAIERELGAQPNPRIPRLLPLFSVEEAPGRFLGVHEILVCFASPAIGQIFSIG
jgi:hypothetical protein